MSRFFILLTTCSISLGAFAQLNQETTAFISQSSGDIPYVVINELDSDQAGSDNMEFVEFYGAPGFALDGMSLVFFNGNDNLSYEAYSLDGVVLDTNGFALIGNEMVPGVQSVFGNGDLQNGPDAVAIMIGTPDQYPNNTDFLTENIVDAIVYGTDDDFSDTGLFELLVEGQIDVNESGAGSGAIHSLSRIPDGGAQRETASYEAQLPTPGFSNVLLCDGGSVSIEEASGTFIELCVDEPNATITMNHMGSTANASLSYVITDTDLNIIRIENGPSIDFTGDTPGSCLIFGVSYAGELVAETIEAGLPSTGINATECISLSFNSIEVLKTDCSIPTCSPATITADGFGDQVAICTNQEDQTIYFSSESDEESFEVVYVLTNDSDEVIEFTDENMFDFEGAGVGVCRVYAVLYQGNLDEESLSEDAPISGVIGDICAEVSTNFVQVQKLFCNETGGCTDLFISEYIEGNSNNKAIEIYNPMSFPADLSGYRVSTFNNGSTTPTNQDLLQGVLAPGEVYVISHGQASTFITNQANNTSNTTWFNGNDAIALYHNNVLIDIMGVIGYTGEASFDVNGVAEGMSEQTLVRNPLISGGNTDWSTGQFEWDVYPLDDFSFIGSHTMVPCDLNEDPSVSFNNVTINTIEGNTVSVNVNIVFPVSEVTVEVTLEGGSATIGDDFADLFPVTLTFPEGDFLPQSFQLPIVDDLLAEGNETIELQLNPITPGVNVINELMTITILANDMEIPVYEIADMITENTIPTIADSLGVVCELRGVVHGENTNPEGVQFTLIDVQGEAGIGAYNQFNNFSYNVTEGDSVHLTGVIDQFNGLTQILIDSIIVQASGLDLMTPQLVTQLDESTESKMVTMRCVRVLNPDAWDPQGAGFTVNVSDGVNTFAMRIDADVDVFNSEAPEGKFTVVGIGGQFDSSGPYDEGYQFNPRYLIDITEPLVAEFSAPGLWNILEGAVQFENNSQGAFSYDWDFGDNNTSGEEEPTNTYASEGVYTVGLTVFSQDGLCSDSYTQQIDIQIISVEEIDGWNLNVYPNPTIGLLNITGHEIGSELTLIDMSGRVLMEKALTSANAQIDLSNIAKGIYFLNVLKGNQVSRTKVQAR